MVNSIKIRLIAVLLWFVGALAAIASVPAGLLIAIIFPKSAYNQNLLVAADQTANTLMGGDPDETISSRLAKVREKYFIACLICRLLDSVDPKHCDRHIETDEGKRDLLLNKS